MAVVTQPGRPRGRGNKAAQPSIVAEKATALGYAEEQILSPVKASEVHPQPRLRTPLMGGASHAYATSALPINLLHTLMATISHAS